MDADATGPTRLTSTSGRASGPAWSPDGGKIAFVDWDGQISVMNADGSGTATQVTTRPIPVLI